MKVKLIAVAALAGLLSGCEARQMNLVSPDLGIFINDRRPVTDKDIQAVLDHRPDVKPGSSIAVVDISQKDSSGRALRIADDQENKGWREAFLDNHFVTDVVFLSCATSSSANNIRLLRKNAAMMKCNLLLVYGVSCDYSRRPNPLSVLYLTLIGGFFIPGDTITAGGIAKAALVDVRNGFVYGVAEASASQTIALPMAWIQSSLSRMYQNVSSQAVRQVQKKIRPLVDRLRDQVVEITD